MALEITDKNFNEIIDNDKPVFVDFWAEWCGPCLVIGPIIEELSNELGDQAVIGKINVDGNPEKPAEFGIRSIPTILVFKNGEIIDKIVGAKPKEEMKEIFESHIKEENGEK